MAACQFEDRLAGFRALVEIRRICGKVLQLQTDCNRRAESHFVNKAALRTTKTEENYCLSETLVILRYRDSGAKAILR
jgi:hypothetical protein